MAGAARGVEQTGDGGFALGTASRTQFNKQPPIRGGDPTVSPTKGPGKVMETSKTVKCEGAFVACQSHKTLAPSPSKAAAGVPAVIDGGTVKTLQDAIERANQLMKEKHVRKVRVTNDEKNRMPDEIAEEEGKAENKWGIELFDKDGDGNVDSYRAEGVGAALHGDKTFFTVGKGGFGGDVDVKLFSGGVGGSALPTNALASGEGAVLKARLGIYGQDAFNPNNYSRAGFTFGVFEGDLSQGLSTGGGGQVGMSAGGGFDVVSASGDVQASHVLFDPLNAIPIPGVRAVVNVVTGGQYEAYREQAFRAGGALLSKLSPALGKKLEGLKDVTVELHAKLTGAAGAVGESQSFRAGIDDKTGRAGADAKFEAEFLGGGDLDVGVSFGHGANSPIKPKGKAEEGGAVPIVGGSANIRVGS